LMKVLQEGARSLGLDLSEGQLAAFARYHELIVAWNKRLNLTSITDPVDVQRKHFLDSLAPLPVLAEEVARQDETEGAAPVLEPFRHLVRKPWRAIDVGAGVGLPGIALKIVWPPLRLTLLDATAKKVRFLNEVIRALGLSQATAIQGRAEELGRDPAFREQFDLVVARGLAPMNTLVEYLLPFARVGGWVMAYKGPKAPQEVAVSLRAVDLLGGSVERIAPVAVPGLPETRFAVLIRKVRPTPGKFPRGRGLPRKHPLS